MSTEQDLLSGVALAAFRLNGQVLDAAEGLARPVGLTAAWWQVLGAVLTRPLTVAGIARDMGITRQSVQRIADLLATRGLAEFVPNPAHRRAKLVRPTPAGFDAVQRLDPAHAALAARLVAELGEQQLVEALAALQRLSAAFEAISAGGGDAAVASAAAGRTPA